MDAAEERCRKALSADPTHADSLHLLGLVYAATNRLDLGIETIGQAIRNNQSNPDYFFNLGTLLQHQGRLDEAFKSYDLALNLKPDSVDVWIKLGDLLRSRNRFDEALLTYSHVLTLDAQNADAATKSGELLRELGRFDEALARFELLAKLLPDNANALCDMGGCLCNLKRSEEAIPLLRRAIEIDAGHVEAHNNLGVALTALRRPHEALAPLETAIRIKPDFTYASNNLAVALIDLRRFEEALRVLDPALAMSPDAAHLLNNRGNALKELGRHSEALACFDQAIALKPDHPVTFYNRAHCLEQMMRGQEGMASYRKALELDPGYADAHLSLGANLMRAGDFKTGWIEGEWRWKCTSLALRRKQVAQPVWRGREPIEGKTLLFHNEQGLGDAIQFCRYVSLAARRGARVILESEPPLRDLLMTLEGVSEIVVKGEALPEFDYHCSLSSLPLAFDTTLDTVPSGTPYLSLPGNARDWQSWLGPANGPRVGLVWSGNPKHGNDHNRSIPLETLLPLLDVRAQFISLQKDLRPSDAAILRGRDDIRDAGCELNSFSDTAALLSQLDLLITVDTSVAHLAGALARPAWVLLPRLPDWRWMLDRDDSPWYPSLRLYRQTETATWPPVVQRVKQVLQTMAARD
jgi:tetratricopeptide (TPR) repeat protein